jgi:hypothetical protein
MLFILWFGLWPKWILDLQGPALSALLARLAVPNSW